MAATYIHGKNATLTITRVGGSSISTAVLQEYEVRNEKERRELDGCGSILLQKVAHIKNRSPGKFRVGAVDAELLGRILGTWTSGTSTGSVYDFTTPVEFTLVFVGTNDEGGTRTVTVSNAVFDSTPLLVGTHEDFVTYEFEFIGKQVTVVDA